MRIVFLLATAFVLASCQHPNFNYYYKSLFPSAFRFLGNPYYFADESPNGIWMEHNPNSGMREVTIESNEHQTEGRALAKQSNELVSPRFFFYNNYDSNFAIQRPTFGLNRRTVVYTTTSTRTIVTTSNCFASSLFSSNFAQCPNRRRDVEAQLKALTLDDGTMDGYDGPTPVQKVEPTASPLIGGLLEQSNGPTEIISSKSVEDDESNNNRPKRFFGLAISTFTVYSFTTSTIARRINAQILQSGTNCPIGIGAGSCFLSCIPIGFTAC